MTLISSFDTKHVQPELDVDEYEQFRTFAEEYGLSLKAAGREALVEWIDRQQQVKPNDQAFTVLEALEEESLSETAATDARTETDIIDKWGGIEGVFTLADDPRTSR